MFLEGGRPRPPLCAWQDDGGEDARPPTKSQVDFNSQFTRPLKRTLHKTSPNLSKFDMNPQSRDEDGSAIRVVCRVIDELGIGGEEDMLREF